MHVIQVTPSVDRESSGPSYSVVRLSDELRSLGVTVSLEALSFSGAPPSRSYITLSELGIGPKRLGRSPQLSARIRVLSQQVGSLIHSHGLWQFATIYPASSNFMQRPLVCSPRGMLSAWGLKNGSIAKKVFWPLFQRPALHKVTCFHATGENEYNEIRALGFKQPVAVVPNGIDIPTLARSAKRPRRTVLFLGRLHPKKGLETLLLAWRGLEHQYPDWSLVIAGSDVDYYGSSGYSALLRRLVTEYRLARVEFVGELLGAEKYEMYDAAELFVLPTRSENFGLTVAEALASGLPAIVTRGAPWAGLEPMQAGWWIEDSAEALNTALTEAMNLPPDVLRAMGERGRAWMSRDYAWPSIAAGMHSVYSWLLDPRSQRPVTVRMAHE